MVKLSKEKFWDKLNSNYPDAVGQFYQWLLEYKKQQQWDILFAEVPQKRSVSFFDLPIAFQYGLFFQYAAEAGCGFDLKDITSVKAYYALTQKVELFFIERQALIKNESLPGAAIIPRLVGNMLSLGDNTISGDSFNGHGGEFGGGGASGKW